MKRPYRYLVLLVANYVFYAWADPSVLLLLLVSTLLTYAGELYRTDLLIRDLAAVGISAQN